MTTQDKRDGHRRRSNLALAIGCSAHNTPAAALPCVHCHNQGQLFTRCDVYPPRHR